LVNCLTGTNSFTEAARRWPNSCRPQTGKYHARRPDPISLPGQGDWFWVGKFHVTGCLFYIPAVTILQVCRITVSLSVLLSFWTN